MFTLSSPVSRCGRPHGRDGRWPWLLAVALAVAGPGLVTACGGQGGAGTSLGATETAAASGSAAARQAPGTARRSSARAVQLLHQAAQAAIAMSYQGQEVVTRWSNGGGSVLVSDIWHVSGGQTVTQTLAAGAAVSSQPYTSADSDSEAPEGVLGVTMSLVRLLEAHYVMAYAGSGSADSKTAQIVEARRDDGTLAARFWLDDATKLPLERVIFDSADHVISQDVFLDVRLVSQPQVSMPAAAGLGADPPGPWDDPLSPAQLLALHSRGWLVPAGLPGSLSLFSGEQTTTSTGAVLNLGYSDGLSVVSLFEQRGHLATKLSGWQKVTVDGHVIYVALPDQRSLTWSGHGMVYTLMADAPGPTVDAVVGALPHDGPPGFWKRMSHGFTRLASWANPFG